MLIYIMMRKADKVTERKTLNCYEKKLVSSFDKSVSITLFVSMLGDNPTIY